MTGSEVWEVTEGEWRGCRVVVTPRGAKMVRDLSRTELCRLLSHGAMVNVTPQPLRRESAYDGPDRRQPRPLPDHLRVIG